MGKDFYAGSAVAREVFDQANQILGFNLSDVCFNGPEDRLNQTDISQPAIYVTSIASFRAAQDAGRVDTKDVAAYAGLSLGEYTALHLAGAFSFEVGLKLVAARGRYMQEAAVAAPSGMVAIIGADHQAVDKICQEAANSEVLVPANYNAPGQVVISGSTSACERALSVAEAAGFRAVALKVAGAFHSPLMQPAADQMRSELDRADIHAPTTTVYANTTARPHQGVNEIKQALVDQIVSPVKWEQIMVELAANADARFIELAPGRTLTGLAKRINRRLRVESFATTEALTGSEA